MNCANHPDRACTAFCQNCGKPLCSECTCTLGSAIFCEPCLAARLSEDTASSGTTGAPYTAPPPPITGVPNPALAGLLGIIPGVGAMYNGQYAKGIAHLVIFAVLVSLSDANSVFGLFVAGWIFYQVIEAHHTARARRDGTPLPNPFGFNDIGEKLGFGKSWPNPATPPVATATSTDAGHPVQPPISDTPNSPSWTTVPTGSYPYPPPPAAPYGTPFAADNAPLPSRQSRFPLGATLLIGFGLLFFFRSSGWLPYFHIHSILPFLLIGIGVWIFVRKMTRSGLSMADDGSAAYKLRLFNALRGSIWIFLIGVLFFLDTFHILSWSHSWPLFIIVAGLMMLFERSTHSLVTPTDNTFAEPVPSPSTPTSSHTEEGR